MTYIRYKLSYFFLNLSIVLIPDEWVRFVMESYIKAGATELQKIVTNKEYLNEDSK